MKWKAYVISGGEKNDDEGQLHTKEQDD